MVLAVGGSAGKGRPAVAAELIRLATAAVAGATGMGGGEIAVERPTKLHGYAVVVAAPPFGGSFLRRWARRRTW